MKPVVLVLQQQVPPYRVPFFRFLANELSNHDILLRVLSSSFLPSSDELGFRHKRVPVSRSGLSALRGICHEQSQALILPHSARYAALAAATRILQRYGRKQLFWGSGLARRYGVESGNDHGSATAASCNDVASGRDRRPVAEAIRRLMLACCDHYLSYTEASTANLVDGGYSAAKITTLNNAVEALATHEQAMKAQRAAFQMIFVASLVEDKEPLAAVAIVDRLRQLTPGATLCIVGDGPLRAQCERAAQERPWVHYHGPQRGQALRDLALASDIAIIPGRTGLAVLEMASAGLPMATFADSLHGSEITYLKDRINGLFLTGATDIAAKELHALLTDRPSLEHMRIEALSTASRYTVENMAINFANGVMASMQ